MPYFYTGFAGPGPDTESQYTNPLDEEYYRAHNSIPTFDANGNKISALPGEFLGYNYNGLPVVSSYSDNIVEGAYYTPLGNGQYEYHAPKQASGSSFGDFMRSLTQTLVDPAGIAPGVVDTAINDIGRPVASAVGNAVDYGMTEVMGSDLMKNISEITPEISKAALIAMTAYAGGVAVGGIEAAAEAGAAEIAAGSLAEAGAGAGEMATFGLGGSGLSGTGALTEAAASGIGMTAAEQAAATAAESAFAVTPEAATAAGVSPVAGTATGVPIGSIAGNAGLTLTDIATSVPTSPLTDTLSPAQQQAATAAESAYAVSPETVTAATGVPTTINPATGTAIGSIAENAAAQIPGAVTSTLPTAVTPAATNAASTGILGSGITAGDALLGASAISALTGLGAGSGSEVTTTPGGSKYTPEQAALLKAYTDYYSKLAGDTNLPAYTGDRVAPINDAQQKAEALLMGYTPYASTDLGKTATSTLTDIMGGGSGKYFEDQYAKTIEEPMLRNWSEKIVPELSGSYAKKGLLYGSGREDAQLKEARTIAEAIAMGRSDLAAKMEAQRLGGVNAATTMGSNALNEATGISSGLSLTGAQKQATEQKVRDTEYEAWLRNQPGTRPQDQIINSILGLSPYYEPTTVVSGGEESMLGPLLNAAATYYGMRRNP